MTRPDLEYKKHMEETTEVKPKNQAACGHLKRFVIWLFNIKQHRNICVRCGHVIKSDEFESEIDLATCYGPMHYCCGKTISHAERYGGKRLPKNLLLDKPF